MAPRSPSAALHVHLAAAALLTACGDSGTSSASDSATATAGSTSATTTPIPTTGVTDVGDSDPPSGTTSATPTGDGSSGPGVVSETVGDPDTTTVAATTVDTTTVDTTTVDTTTVDTTADTTAASDTDTTTGGDPPTPQHLKFEAIREYSLGGLGAGGGSYHDVDADGRTDLVLARTDLNQINIILAAADGTYALGPTYPAAKPHFAAVADVDGDAVDDILTTRTDAGLWLLHGKGDGTFAAAVDRPGVAAKLRPVLADIDDDADLDMLAVDTGKDIHVYTNDGLGNFTARPKVPQLYTSRISAVDLDDDDRADLVSVNSTGLNKHFVNIGLSVGDGTFMMLPSVEIVAKNNIAIGKLGGHAVGDIDDDGRPDIVVGDTLGLTVLLGGPGGTFTPGGRYDGGEFGSGVALGDWNADGKLDLAHPSYDDALLYVRDGLGDGTFTDPARSYNVAHGCGSGSAVHIDGDPHLDLVLGCTGIGVALGRGDGTLRAAPALLAGIQPYESAIGDFNEDGHPDVVTGFISSKNIAVFPGLGDGSFGPALPLLKEVGEPRYVRVADMNADGHLDLVTYALNGMQQALRVRLGDGAGHFADPPVATVPNMVWPEVADLDGDGDLDVVTNGLDGINVLRNDGGGALTPDASVDADGFGPETIAIADLDQDGDVDVIGGHYELKELELFWNAGDGTFAGPTTILPSPHTVFQVLAADFTGDGAPDLLRATLSDDPVAPGIVILPGNGDGTFGAGIESAQIQFGYSGKVLAADFNNDGRLDLFHTRGNAFVAVRPGLGDGTFGADESYPFEFPGSFAAGDLDHDGLRDVVISTRTQQKRSHVAVYINIAE